MSVARLVGKIIRRLFRKEQIGNKVVFENRELAQGEFFAKVAHFQRSYRSVFAGPRLQQTGFQ